MSADWTVDIFEQEGSLVVEAGLSGVRFEDVSVMLRDSHLVISACRPPESGVRRYHLRGRRTPRQFSRDVMLPPNARADLATASYAHGLLRICIPLGSDDASPGRPIPVKDLTAAGTARRRESTLERDGDGSPAGAGMAKGGPAPDPGSGLPSLPHAVSVRRCARCDAPMEPAAEGRSSDSRRFGLCAACRRSDPEP